MAVLQAFREALPGVALEANHNFFLHGGDSMGAAQVAENLGVSTSMVVRHPTVRSLAKALQRPPDASEPSSPREGRGDIAAVPSEQPGSPLRWADGSQQEVVESVAEPGAEPVLSQAQAQSGDKVAVLGAEPVLSKAQEQSAAVPGTIGFVLRSHGVLRKTTTRGSPADETDVAAAAQHEAGLSGAEMEDTDSKGGKMNRIACVWRTRLDMCVDAAPVLLVPGRDGAASTPSAAEGVSDDASVSSRPPEELRVVCCSHGGDVAVLRGSDGLELWRTRLPFPADGGVAVTNDLAHVAVASGEYVYFLKVRGGSRVYILSEDALW